jgi:hypothetical protein
MIASEHDLFSWAASRPTFDGATYDPDFDETRLTGQLGRVYACMKDGRWRTLGEVEDATGDPQASISARLRDFRKARCGSHEVDRRRRGPSEDGLWEYRLIKPERQKT